MPSSKVWRKGRWFWSCNTQNRCWSWKDHWACGAISRLTYSTNKEARIAGNQHARKFGHTISVNRIVGKK